MVFKLRFTYEVRGALTKKQKQKLDTISEVVAGFYDEFDTKQPRTIKELKQVTGLSSGVLSKHMQELVEKGIVKGTVEVREFGTVETKNKRLTMVFEYDGQTEYFIEGSKKEKVKDGMRFKMMKTTVVDAKRGHFVRGKLGKDKKTKMIKRSWRFIPEKEKQNT